MSIEILDVAQYGAPLPRLLGSCLTNHDGLISNRIVFVDLDAVIRRLRTEILHRAIFSNLNNI